MILIYRWAGFWFILAIDLPTLYKQSVSIGKARYENNQFVNMLYFLPDGM
jgi:hypothetical protein